MQFLEFETLKTLPMNNGVKTKMLTKQDKILRTSSFQGKTEQIIEVFLECVEISAERCLAGRFALLGF